MRDYLQPKETKQETELNYTVADVLPHLDRQSKAKIFQLDLTEGPYTTNFSLNGNHLAICGRKGHIGILSWKQQKLVKEFNVGENCYGIQFFHTFHMFAVAQEKVLHIYDDSATQLHSLLDVKQPRQMTFLPYHFLLAVNCLENKAKLRYLDVSTGEMAATHLLQTPTSAMTYNPYNAVIVNGHNSGAITLWTPNMGKPVVGLAHHKAGITGLSCTSDGNLLASSSLDGTIRFVDLRMMKEDESRLMSNMSRINSIDYSQRNLLAVGKGTIVEIFNEKNQRVTTQRPIDNNKDMITSCEFCPYEDFMCVGRYKGINTIPVPGSGSSALDTFENNIYETTKDYKESEIQKLLDKIPADMITLNPNLLGKVADKKDLQIREQVIEQMKDENAKTKKQKQRREALKKRLADFEEKKPIGKPLKKKRDEEKPISTPIEERSALDLFK